MGSLTTNSPKRTTRLLRDKIQRNFPEIKRDLQIKRPHDVPGKMIQILNITLKKRKQRRWWKLLLPAKVGFLIKQQGFEATQKNFSPERLQDF